MVGLPVSCTLHSLSIWGSNNVNFLITSKHVRPVFTRPPPARCLEARSIASPAGGRQGIDAGRKGPDGQGPVAEPW